MAPKTQAPRVEKVRRVSAHETIVRQLEDRILRGELAIGDRLPSEREMTEQLGVSRATVREAFRVAESAGLIEVRQGEQGGALVVARPNAGIVRVFESLLRTSIGSLTDVIELRMLLEGASAYMAAGQDEVEPLEEAFDGIAEANNDDDRYRADALFHLREAEASGNAFLTVVASSLYEPVFRSITVGAPSLSDDGADARDLTIQRHRDVLDAIKAKDGELACTLSRRYLYETYAPLMPSDEDRARLEAMRDFRNG